MAFSRHYCGYGTENTERRLRETRVSVEKGKNLRSLLTFTHMCTMQAFFNAPIEKLFSKQE